MSMRLAPCLASLAAAALAPPALAHPHVFIDARAEIVFDDNDRLAAIRHIWRFDEAFTAFAVDGLDADGDGAFSVAELDPLAKVNVDSLAEFGFFSYVIVDDEEQAFTAPDEYWLSYDDGQLTLFYTLPLAPPAAVNGTVTIQVFDPEFFVAFQFVPDDPATLIDAPPGCDAVYTPPGEIDVQTLVLLGQIPMDQRELPPDLRRAASVAANAIAITCP